MGNTNTVPQALFGPGVAVLTRNDGGSGADPTPFNVGYVNELSIDISFETKDLYGQNQFPLVVARGTAKTTGKMKAATLSGRALNTVLYGGTWTTGTQYFMGANPATAIPATPFTITPTVPNSGTFDADLGVTNASTGEPLTLVTGTPTAGEYSQSAGVYTFSSADNVSGVSVIINFAYKVSSGEPGQFQVIQNNLIGTTPTFQLDYATTLYGSTYYVRLYRCVGSKVQLQHKTTDYAMPEYDFSFFANPAQEIGMVSLATTA